MSHRYLPSLSDVFVMHVRAQNAAVIIRVLVDHVRFEMFEVSPQTSAVMSTNGKLLCSYPGPAVQVSHEVFVNSFRSELASFLVQMDIDVLDSTPTTSKAGSSVREVRESAHPRYISELLVGILRGFGQPASVDRITKRIADEVLWEDAYKPWRRSPLWLVIRVALQTSLDSDTYKAFMLFFHARLLQTCEQRKFPNETLHLMRIKIVRRLSKLVPTVSDGLYQFVCDTAKETEEVLQNRWSSFQKSQSTSPPWDPVGLHFHSDTAITFNNSRTYLMDALVSTSHSYPQTQFRPSHQPRLANTAYFPHFADGRLTVAVTNDRRIALADFESSVERHLDSWVKLWHGDDALEVLASCVEQYFSSAKEIYGADPEENSTMILTIMDLWKALDTLTIRQCPLLASYSPEIPGDFLHPLLLHRSGSLLRAKLIEEYILRRHEEASCSISIFSDRATESSFAVQYYRDSPQLRQLHTDIKQRAQREREEKRAELRVMNAKRQSLKNEASAMEHTHYWGRRHCEKCQTNDEANGLEISVHEWPLPQEPQKTLQAQSVVFEISPPRAFSTWREITYKILYDIGTPDIDDYTEPKLPLDKYSGLRGWAVHHEYHRITIASTTKSFSDQTHYRAVRIPADESDVLLNNGLSFKLFDRGDDSWAARSFARSSITNFCTPPPPVSSPYGKIHSFVAGTHHTSNEVIAAQADCPAELSLHEYIAFAGLRSGPRLQWLNIARELPSPSLSFRREEVHTLITQAAWQLGPLLDDVREWHLDLGYPSFGRTLLHELEALRGRIEANWLEEGTIRTIGMSNSTLRCPLPLVQQYLALLTSRLLSSARDPNVCQSAYTLLRDSRSVAYKWIGELGSKLSETEGETSRANLRRRLCILAATCFSTYDVCPEHVPGILSSDLDFAIAVHCSVIVHDNTPPTLNGGCFGYLGRLLNRHRRLLHFLEPFFHQGVKSNPTGFDRGVASLWSDFCRQNSSNWDILPSPNSRWISCTVECGQEVHYNLLTGKLLINGSPLGTLPREIVEHSTYACVLGSVSIITIVIHTSHLFMFPLQRILDVIPADKPGMEFMTRLNVSEYQVRYCRP